MTNPATGEVVRHVPLADAADVDAAVAAAAAAFPAWRAHPPLRRARIMMRFRELMDAHRKDLAKIITQEHGKTLADAEGEVTRGIEVIEFATGIPHLLKGEFSENVGTEVDSFSLRQPLGVCAGITPFNFPAMVPLWMFPVAIACGNTFVLKPSERDPTLSIRMAELLKEAGLPDGVFNVVHGDKEAVDALLAHPVGEGGLVRRLDADREVHLRDRRAQRQARAGAGRRQESRGGAAGRGPRVRDRSDHRRGLRLGGRALHGDLGDRRGRRGGRSAGERELAERARRVTRRARAMRANIEMGPVITCAARDRIKGYIDRGVEEGAQLVVDGRNPGVAGDGFFVGPTLFDHVSPSMAIYRDEIFGPVLSVVRVESLTDAIALINANPYANGTAIFTRSGHAARKFQQDVEVGMVGVNVPDPGADGVLLVRRLARVAVRRPQRARHGRRALLYARQDAHDALARRRQRRAGLPHADAGLSRLLRRAAGAAAAAGARAARNSNCSAIGKRIGFEVVLGRQEARRAHRGDDLVANSSSPSSDLDLVGDTRRSTTTHTATDVLAARAERGGRIAARRSSAVEAHRAVDLDREFVICRAHEVAEAALSASGTAIASTSAAAIRPARRDRCRRRGRRRCGAGGAASRRAGAAGCGRVVGR